MYMKMYGKDREKGIISEIIGVYKKNKLQNIIIFIYLNREVINFSLRVGLIVFVWL